MRGISVIEDYEEIDLKMSNFGHTIDKGFADTLKQRSGVFGRHYGWEFNGRVWFERGQFHEEVWRYHSPREVILANTLEELMEKVNDKYGWN